MRRIFDMDNPLMQGLSVIADMMILNLLTLICSIPVVTLGAALTAMNAVVIRMLNQEEGTSIAKTFFVALKQNLKTGCLLGLLFLLAAGLLCFDYLAASAYVPPFRFVVVALAVLLLGLGIYAFALLSRYDNTVFGTIRNAALLAVGYFPKTAGMLCFSIALWLLCIHFFRYGAPVLFLFGLSLPCYVCVILMRDMFRKLEENNGGTEP